MNIKTGPELLAQVKAVNAANRKYNELLPILTEFFRPYVGQKIETANGSFIAKIDKSLPELPETTGITVVRNVSQWSLGWNIKACENVAGKSYCLYHDVTLTIGEMQGDTLVKLSNHGEPLRTDYNLGEITEKIQTLRDAEQAFDNAKSDLHPFLS